MRTIWPILRPYRFWMILAIALVGVQAATELALPTLMASIVDEGIVYGDTGHILRVGTVMLVVTAVSMAASVIGARIAARSSMAFGRDMRGTVFAHATNFSLKEFDRLGTATLITRTTNDVEQIERVVFMSQRMFSRAPMMAIGSLFFAFRTDPGLAWILLIAIPVLALVVWFISSKSMPLFQAMQEKIDRLNLVSREGLAGIRVIRAFNRTQYEEQRFEEAN
ncbi:MAG: ABC transporter ATP-binding protein, partial [Firmicutes bacterium]|nr:ABC transporter ATP-binding protein [Bacillota bacterium]